MPQRPRRSKPEDIKNLQMMLELDEQINAQYVDSDSDCEEFICVEVTSSNGVSDAQDSWPIKDHHKQSAQRKTTIQ